MPIDRAECYGPIYGVLVDAAVKLSVKYVTKRFPYQLGASPYITQR